MEIIALNSNNIKEIVFKSVDILGRGGSIIYPTETCYGIAVDATNQKAVDNLYKYKGFRGQKPFSMAVCDIAMAKAYVDLNETALNLYKNYLPGPVTVISSSLGRVAKGVESAWQTVGIRIPNHNIPIEIIRRFGKPITATSCNISYKPVVYDIKKYLKQTPKKSLEFIDLIIDAGVLPKNVPSTILDTTLNSLEVLRAGKIEFENAIQRSKKVSEIITKTPEETVEFGKKIAKQYIENHDNSPLVFALSGELGAGKTQFTKGIGEYLNVKDVVNSPTYTIINEYNDKEEKLVLVHMDTWRIEDNSEFNRSGLQEYLENSEIISIEWADKYLKEIEDFVSEFVGKIVKVNFEYININERKITVYEEK
ncbi:L-threonylcarbamoyladenylate synthase [Candidatus Dojkabacteria bacterium]|jgi:L-threonylcarbamoyladenylate synthase|nr:L-threonylcarbamoyladenylate synthase [Candidatus Dojkabacteria bacterium]